MSSLQAGSSSEEIAAKNCRVTSQDIGTAGKFPYRTASDARDRSEGSSHLMHSQNGAVGPHLGSHETRKPGQNSPQYRSVPDEHGTSSPAVSLAAAGQRSRMARPTEAAAVH